MIGFENFIDLNLQAALEVVFLGFVGGVLSGFIGTGGAFFMTPGMMNLGVPGIIAVGSNITHKFGKAIMGARRHRELGHVDRKLGLLMLITALIGVRLGVWVNETLFKAAPGEGDGGVIGDLYISIVFVVVLGIVGLFMLIDTLTTKKGSDRPFTGLSDFLARVRIPPMVTLKTSDVRLSFWIIAAVGLVTGYLAGAVGIGGFVGVPAMIYAFGIPTAVAAGTELYLAIFTGAFGAVNYAFSGMIDLRLTLLLYLGSLSGIYIGVYGTRVVTERVIRLVTTLIILLCVVSRLIGIPVYLDRLEVLSLPAGSAPGLNLASKTVLFTSGLSGVIVILAAVARSYRRRRKVQELLRVIGK